MIQETGVTGAPLSNTDWIPALDAVASSNGAHSSPGSAGLERREIGSPESCSPIRVPPAVAAYTLRPSSASRAAAVQYA